MSKLKNLLQYDASQFIHVGIVIVLFYLTRTTYFAFILMIPEVIYLFRHSKNILIYSIILIVVLSVRFQMIDIQNNVAEFPITGEVTEVSDNYFILKEETRILCYYEDLSKIKPGQIITVKGYQIDTSTYQMMHTFDYDLYLKSEQINYVISINEIISIKNTFHIGIIKYYINHYIDENFNAQTASFLKLFILGDNTLDQELKEMTILLGISHLFAISGMHLALIVGFIKSFLKRLHMTKETSDYFIIVALLVFNLITGFKTSIIRASLLVILLMVRKKTQTVFTKTDLLTFIFIGFIIYNPYIFYSLGFQLSFIVSVSIMMGKYLFQTENQIQKMMRTTLLATVISLPITLEINHQIGILFLFSNVYFILYVSYLFLPISFITLFFPFIEKVHLFISNIFIYSAELLSEINMIITFNFPTSIHKLLFYTITYFIIVNIKNIKRLVICMLSLILLFIISFEINNPSSTYVRFLDVSQGDAIHIKDNSCNMLIDTGDVDDYDNLINYFKGFNIDEIDILLITHFHSDHYGELEDLVNQLNVKIVYVNDDYPKVSNYYVIKEGFCFECGTSKFQVIHANENSTNENNNSIVLFGQIKNDHYLFTGDMEEEVEKYIINKYRLDIDILKVAHHGSNTSSTEKFLQQISGDIAIISVGEKNKYNLPDETILERLEKNQYTIYRTDIDGTITFYYYPIFHKCIIEFYELQKRSRYILRDI